MNAREKIIQGTRVPTLGMGTYELEGRACREAVTAALEMGYRHIDTARAYGNEASVGAAIAESGILRDRLFITSKVWFDKLRPDDVLSEVDASLRSLRTDYLDLALIHWPNEEIPLADTLTTFKRLRDEGIIRHVGVSNFTPELLDQALRAGPIFCNQVEYHVLLRRNRLHQMAVEHDLLMTAYSPLAQGDLGDHRPLSDVARKHGCSVEQAALAWLLGQAQVAAIPRSGNPEHLRSNLAALEIVLDEEDRRRIEELPDGRHVVDPEFAPAWEK
ncbi:aldo/keto reductase [Haloferula sp. A504]|uniref:aldo/keto reductase n=1 Tax=Haloferula sp. A504 TaxID=3373601 RepID=UPI0031BC7876|nr:aldo/keto reductase [Verrucomicrobiaceae bacterium E54]